MNSPTLGLNSLIMKPYSSLTDLDDHCLKGRIVDLDWRSQKEKDLPYTFDNRNVIQGVTVKEVKMTCHGDIWLYTSNSPITTDAKRVCKVY
jgi:hypothetical protein